MTAVFSARLRPAVGSFLLALALAGSGAARAATITLVPGAGFSDRTPATPEGGNSGTTLGQQRTNLFNAAAAAWGVALTSSQTIKIEAQFTALPCTAGSGTLGSAGATNYYALNDGSSDRWFPVALAEALAAENLNNTDTEISANFNATIDANDSSCLGNTRWYYGLTGPAPAGTLALYPTVLHEIGHGLGFAAFLCRTPAGCSSPATPYGGYFLGVPDVWSDYLRDNNIDGAGTNKLWSAMTNAERVTSFTHDPLVVWDGPNVTAKLASFGQDGAELNEARMRMHAPNPLVPGSSISHFHEDASPNLLMEPIADADVFAQTDLTDCLLQDIGWINSRCNNAPPALNAIANPAAINEDAGTRVINLSGINDGSGGTQTLAVTAVSGNLPLLANPTVVYSSPATTGSLSYAPVANKSGSAIVTVTVTDSAGGSVQRNFTVVVNPVNDAPSASNLAAAQSYIEDAPLNLTDIVTGDVDHADLTVTLTLSNPAAGALGTATSGSVTSTYSAITGIWKASGPIANLNALLVGVTFTPAANFNGNFNIATRVSDGVASALTGSKAITGVPLNDAPTATHLSAAEGYTEDSPRDLTNIVVADVDSASVTATLTLSTAAAGSLSTATSGAVTSSYNPGTGVWSASGALANVNALLAGVTFQPAANFNGNLSLATRISDGVAAALTGSKTLSGTAVNDAPLASNLSAPETYDSGAALNLVDIVVSDLDGDAVTVTLTLSNPAAGSLNTATSGAVTSSFVAATGVWSASGAPANLNTLLANLVFTPAAGFDTAFAIQTRVSDGIAAASTGSKAMAVGAGNSFGFRDGFEGPG